MIISAAIIYSISIDMTANVPSSGSVIVEINGTNYTNGQDLDIAWGAVGAGAHTKEIKIYSSVNTPVTPSISANGLPNGWTLALSDTSAIPAHGTSTRNIVLTVPSNPAMGDYSWSATLNVATS